MYELNLKDRVIICLGIVVPIGITAIIIPYLSPNTLCEWIIFVLVTALILILLYLAEIWVFIEIVERTKGRPT